MPYKNITKKREYDREWRRKQRKRLKELNK